MTFEKGSTTMALPDMSSEDRIKALENAKAARSRRAALLREVTAGTTTVAQVLEMAQGDPCYERIKVTALLKAVPGYGDIRVERLMKSLRIAESRRLRGLGPHQRAALIEHFSLVE